jgi:hypothetical protein
MMRHKNSPQLMKNEEEAVYLVRDELIVPHAEARLDIAQTLQLEIEV